MTRPSSIASTGGCAIAVEEARIREWIELSMASEGISVCPETAACVGAMETLVQRGWIKPDERVVIFNTGGVQKYVEAITSTLPKIDLQQPIDWEMIASI